MMAMCRRTDRLGPSPRRQHQRNCCHQSKNPKPFACIPCRLRARGSMLFRQMKTYLRIMAIGFGVAFVSFIALSATHYQQDWLILQLAVGALGFLFTLSRQPVAFRFHVDIATQCRSWA